MPLAKVKSPANTERTAKLKEEVIKQTAREANTKVRTSFNLDPKLQKELRIHCAETGRSLTWCIEKALKDFLAAQKN